MSSESVLEAEELDNVPLVRMEDVQPDRSGDYTVGSKRSEGSPTYYEYDTCMVDDDDSNIGSMVSIQSEEVPCEDEAEIIVPEVLETMDHSYVSRTHHTQPQQQTSRISGKPSGSWPTLEILPGGVINPADKTDHTKLEPLIADREAAMTESMMYACAKCPERFKYLFCLVKHVRSHEDQKQKACFFQDFPKLSPIEQQMAELDRRGSRIYRNNKGKGVNPVAPNKTRVKTGCQRTVKAILMCKPKLRRVPKKS